MEPGSVLSLVTDLIFTTSPRDRNYYIAAKEIETQISNLPHIKKPVSTYALGNACDFIWNFLPFSFKVEKEHSLKCIFCELGIQSKQDGYKFVGFKAET